MRDGIPPADLAGLPATVGEGPLAAYRRFCLEGRLEADPAQRLAAEKLQGLHNALARQGAAQRGGWLDRLRHGHRAEAPPHGLYIFGEVGRGKSMLMDLFFAGAPVEAKRRVHFHAFMLDVHDQLHRRRKAASGDPIPSLAAAIAAQTRLICFDEFQVTNIADAMLLGRLFEGLLDEDLVVVATSNWAPDDLYQGGLQRDRFLPFIDLLKARLDILELDGATDYRRRRIRDLALYHTPLGPRADRALAAAFARLTDDAAPAATTLAVQGRQVAVPRSARGVAWFQFDELCRKPLGPADYLAIATHFETVILDGIPKLRLDERNEARRFMTLIDALYEHRTRLIAAAADAPDRLYPSGDGAFDFRRAASRLIEMQSRGYLDRPHLP
jgi:cell division protein ZapE